MEQPKLLFQKFIEFLIIMKTFDGSETWIWSERKIEVTKTVQNCLKRGNSEEIYEINVCEQVLGLRYANADHYSCEDSRDHLLFQSGGKQAQPYLLLRPDCTGPAPWEGVWWGDLPSLSYIRVGSVCNVLKYIRL